jgi:uncharacterized protein
MSKAESRKKAAKVIRKYAKKLEKENFSFHSIYLFGSYAKGKVHKWSDIDIAVVSDEIRKDWDNNRKRLWKLRMGVDTRIEPHGFSREDFENESSPMAYEIKKTGVRII